jgi:hypothetical protein
MRRKLLRRTRRQKGELSANDLKDIESRASSAYREMQEAWHFEYVIPNHDGEDSDNWEAFYYPLGDARKTLDAFAALLKGVVPPNASRSGTSTFAVSWKRPESNKTVFFLTTDTCEPLELRLELNVCPERRHHYRPAVAVVAGIVDVLRPRSKIDSAPHVQRVIGFHDILPPVVQPAIAEQKT